jgi:transposase
MLSKLCSEVASGDACSAVASKAGISLGSFYKWDPKVESSCQGLY